MRGAGGAKLVWESTAVCWWMGGASREGRSSDPGLPFRSALVQPVLQMVSSDFVGRKKDSATLRREVDGSFSRFLCCSSVSNSY